MLRDFATEQGFHIVGEYIDDGWSGTNFDRPDFQRMIDDIEDGKINCVITKDLSRLGRNYILTGQYTEIYFPSKNVRYIAISDDLDSDKGENDIANVNYTQNYKALIEHTPAMFFDIVDRISLQSGSDKCGKRYKHDRAKKGHEQLFRLAEILKQS